MKTEDGYLSPHVSLVSSAHLILLAFCVCCDPKEVLLRAGARGLLCLLIQKYPATCGIELRKKQWVCLHPNVHRGGWKNLKHSWSFELALIFQSWKMYFNRMTFSHPENNSKATEHGWSEYFDLFSVQSWPVCRGVFPWCFSLCEWCVFSAHCVVGSCLQKTACQSIRERTHRLLRKKGNRGSRVEADIQNNLSCFSEFLAWLLWQSTVDGNPSSLKQLVPSHHDVASNVTRVQASLPFKPMNLVAPACSNLYQKSFCSIDFLFARKILSFQWIYYSKLLNQQPYIGSRGSCT